MQKSIKCIKKSTFCLVDYTDFMSLTDTINYNSIKNAEYMWINHLIVGGRWLENTVMHKLLCLWKVWASTDDVTAHISIVWPEVSLLPGRLRF